MTFGKWATYAFSGAVLLLFGHSLLSFYRIMYPTFDFEAAGRGGVMNLEPLWQDRDSIDFYLVLRFPDRSAAKGRAAVIKRKVEDFAFSWDSRRELKLELRKEEIGPGPWHSFITGVAAPTLSVRARSNNASLSGDGTASTALTTMRDQPPQPAKRNLLREPFSSPSSSASPVAPARTVPHLKQVLHVSVVADSPRMPMSQLPPHLGPVLRPVSSPAHLAKAGVRHYVPFVFCESFGLASDGYQPLNDTVTAVNVTLVVETVPYSRFSLFRLMEHSLAQMQTLGASNRDLDDLRSMVTDNHPLVLALTMIVTSVHLLFDVLAIKNDILFWRGRRDMRGISVRVLATSLVCEVVIALYLYHEHASLLVLGPTCAMVALSVWKLSMATAAHVEWSGFLPRIVAPGHRSYTNTVTADCDRLATSYMSALLMPLVLGMALRSLVCDEHEGWYAWLITAAVGAVYTFGFILMTPQLFINYRLKSVAHLPWRVLLYRSLNTFIDDLFAFIIRMPTLHRLSTLRDDIVFMAFLYQRWVYPVDKQRVEGFEGEEDVQGGSRLHES